MTAANDELDRAATALRDARENVSAALAGARNAACGAYDAGLSEVKIADRLGVNRATVREWIGKPRRR